MATFILIIYSLFLHAAPYPGTATSKIVGSDIGLFQSANGFTINSANTGWMLRQEKHEKDRSLARFIPPKDSGTLSVRFSKLKNPVPLDKYVKNWFKEFPRFGFEVLSSQSFSLRNHPGFVVDLYHRQQKQQLRQAVFVKDSRVVMLTCRDHADKFSKSLKACNEIMRTLTWTN